MAGVPQMQEQFAADRSVIIVKSRVGFGVAVVTWFLGFRPLAQ
jgi:hypothetical protein